MASTYLTRTFGTATNRKIWTWSAWVKRQNLVSDHTNAMFGAYTDGSNRSVIRFYDHELNFQDSGNSVEIKTSRKFRDMNSWYHIVARVDTTQSTASDRIRIYVNGEQETAFDQADYPNQNVNMEFQNSVVHYINARHSGTAVDSIADMSYSHVHFIDGTAYDASAFGSVDNVTGEWKINTSPSVSYGNNGFFILKDGNSVTDQSGNSNNFTVAGGTLTKTEDCPDNVFATFNPLDHKSTGWNMQNGNTRLQGTGGATWETRRAISTIGASTGKYYAELKMTTAGNDSYPFGVGYDVFDLSYSSSMGSNSNFWGYYQPAGGQIYGGGTGSPLETSLGGGTGDIIGIALDIDNLTLQFYKNGSTMGSQITGLPSGKTWFFASSGYHNTNTFDCNFGNGYFSTSQVSSAGTNASGNGIFEYDVPTGFTALSTKGLNQ
tara:strand:- start:5 stop:1309 length:1305 start_codon:yes stop_codon:yes gene_type:complete